VDSEVAARVTLSGLILQFIWQQSAERVPGLAIDADRLIDSAADVLLNSLQPRTSSARRTPSSRRRRA
jgi:hypothetical protein